MTQMKRITVSFPDSIIIQIERLKRTERYKGAPDSMIIRDLVQKGLERSKGGKNDT